MRHRDSAFSLIELVIVVMILGIMAMIVIPKYASSADDAREKTLSTDYATALRQLELYKHQHGGKTPDLAADGSLDTANFIKRMTGKTDADGTLNANGTFGPYLIEWPTNPFVSGAAGAEITFGKYLPATRNGRTGWYYTTTDKKLYINTDNGAGDPDEIELDGGPALPSF